MRQAAGQAGRTLMETMTVVSVLGLSAIMAADAWLPAARHNQAQAVRAELAGELRVARRLAMARGRTVQVRLDVGGARLTVQTVADQRVLRTLEFSGKGVVIERVSNGPDILFYGTGRAATPTTVALGAADGDKLYELTVSITGRVRLR